MINAANDIEAPAEEFETKYVILSRRQKREHERALKKKVKNELRKRK